jgi:hypothetical protein
VGSLDKARAEDLLHLCKKRGFASGDFLSPAEEKVFLATLNALKKEETTSVWKRRNKDMAVPGIQFVFQTQPFKFVKIPKMISAAQ